MRKRWIYGGISLLVLLGGCFSKKYERDDIMSLEEKTLLADYYERVVGTEEEQPYYELALYTYDGKHLLLEQYTNGGTPQEHVKGCLVPEQAYDDFMDAVRSAKMDKWNTMKDTLSLDGKTYVCKYYQGGTINSVSSDKMPEDGMKAFDAVYQALAKYRDDQYLEYEYDAADRP